MDSKHRYERLLRCIQYQSATRPACRERSVRTALVAHGDLEVDEYESSLKAAQERSDVVCESGYVCYPVDRQMATAAIQYVVEQSDDASDFVGAMNGLVDAEL